jgi:glutamate racemase
MSMPEREKICIAFYDSGIGGLPYFERTAALLPGADYCYLADSAHFPLGEKPRDEVLAILHDEVGAVVENCSPRIFVIACNTASTIALAALRQRYPDIAFVGTVPAVKPAAARTKSGKIAVIATSRTVSDPYTLDLVKRFAAEADTSLVAAPEWVEFVERRWLSSTLEQRIAIASPIVSALLDQGVDEIVLACTHFLFLEDAVSSLAGGRAEVIDSAQGVSRRVQELCRERYPELSGEAGRRTMYSSGGQANAGHAAMAARFGLEYGGPLR